LIWVLEASALPDYRLQLRFSDGSAGTISLKDFVFADSRPIVAALRDSVAFAAVSVVGDTVSWANGFDLAPEFLHAKFLAEDAA